MRKCKECDYSDIFDWDQDTRTGRAIAIYWCERYRTYCSDIQECKYENGIEVDKESEKE